MPKCNINLSLPLSDINCCDSQSRRCTRAQDITRRCSVICFVIVFRAFINFYYNYHCFCCNPCFAVHLLVGSCWLLLVLGYCSSLSRFWMAMERTASMPISSPRCTMSKITHQRPRRQFVASFWPCGVGSSQHKLRSTDFFV